MTRDKSDTVHPTHGLLECFAQSLHIGTSFSTQNTDILQLDSYQGLRFFPCPMLVSYWSVHFSHFITKLKVHHLYSFITLTMTLTVLTLAICRMSVTYELSYMTLLSSISHSSVNRVPTWCSGGDGFCSRHGLRFFFVSCSNHIDQFTLHIIVARC